MKVLGLDLSTHAGYGILENGKVLIHGTAHIKSMSLSRQNHIVPDYDKILVARQVAFFVHKLIAEHDVGMVIIEQTNGSSFRTTQKELEFIHYAVLEELENMSQSNFISKPWVHYIDTSKWRSLCKLNLSKEQKKHNKAVGEGKAKGRVTKKHLAVSFVNERFGLKLLKKDHDAAEAICMAMCADYFKEQPKVTQSVEEALGISKG